MHQVGVVQAQAVKVQSTGMSLQANGNETRLKEIESPTIVHAEEGSAAKVPRGGPDGTKSSPLDLLEVKIKTKDTTEALAEFS